MLNARYLHMTIEEKKMRTRTYEEAGPLANLFGSAEAKVLDQSLIVGNMEQTIRMLSDSTGLKL